MNRVFYIFRHGETDWNIERRCQGHTNIPLNSNGLTQALDLASRLEHVPLDIVVTSDLERAYVTGRTVAEKKSIPLIIDPRLRETHFGQAEGMLFNEAIDTFGPELWEKLLNFKSEFDHIGFPGGETRKVARDRIVETLMHLIETTEHTKIGISTHGAALRNTLHTFLPEDHPTIAIPNCVLYRLVYDSEEKKFLADPAPFEFLIHSKEIGKT
jgi:probable phosphoglycerate mutase